MENIPERKCEVCQETKIVHDFPINHSRRDKISLKCKVCTRLKRKLNTNDILRKNNPNTRFNKK